MDIAPLGAEIPAEKIREDRGHNLAEPGDELGLAGPTESLEVAMRFEEGLLDEVGGIDLGLKAVTDFNPGQELEVMPIEFQ